MKRNDAEKSNDDAALQIKTKVAHMNTQKHTHKNTQKPHENKFVLGIECSNPSTRGENRGEVGLGKIGLDGTVECIAWRGLSSEARGSDGLMAAIDVLTREHGVGPVDIGRVVVSIGPGGYTALRVSVTVAKTLAMVMGCPLVGVPTAAVAAVNLVGLDGQGDEQGNGQGAVIALASKNGKAHCTLVVDGELEELGVIGADGVAGCGAGGVGGGGVFVGDEHVPAEIVEAAVGAGMEIRGIELTAFGCLRASGGYMAVGVDEMERLGPLYAREPDAVTQWRALGKGG